MKYVEMYLNEKTLSKQEKTISNYRQSLKLFTRFIDPLPIEKAGKADVMRYLEHCIKNNRKRSSVATYQTQLKTFYKWMVEEGHINENPLSRIDKIRYEQTLPIYLTVEELRVLLKTAINENNERTAMAIKLLYATGIRVGELIKIKKSDIDWQGQRIKIYGKGAKQRTVEVPGPFLDDLKEYCNYYDDDIKIFDYCQGTIQKDFRILRGKSGINKKVTPHKLRHSFATHMIQNDGNVEAVRKLLGHTSLTTTQRYIHLGEREIRRQCDCSHPMFKGEI